MMAMERAVVETKQPDATEDGPAAALKALAHTKRLKLLRFVTEPRSLDEIARHLKIARQTAQEHLDQLLENGFVTPQRGKGDHGPITQYIVAVSRVFDVYDRLGSELGVLGELNENVTLHAPTTRLSTSPTPPKAANMPRLVIVHGMRVGHTIPLAGTGPWLLGRDAAATLCLDYDPYVSHRQAEIRRTANGFELVDALSSNGTYADWTLVPRGGSVPLQAGSLIRAGKTLILFRDR